MGECCSSLLNQFNKSTVEQSKKHWTQLSRRYLVFIIILVLGAQIAVSAQSHIWTGTLTGGDGIAWHNPLNWQGGMVPNAGDEVLLRKDSVVVYNKHGIGRLDLQKARLMILGSLNIGNSDTFALLAFDSYIYNRGELIIEEAGNGNFGDRAVELEGLSKFENDSIIEILDVYAAGIRLEDGPNFINNHSISI